MDLLSRAHEPDKAAIDCIREGNGLRTTDDNFRGLSGLIITNELMAIGEMNANWNANSPVGLAHPSWYGQDMWSVLIPKGYYGYGENIASTRSNPFDGWYTAEKAIYDSGNHEYSKLFDDYYDSLAHASDKVEAKRVAVQQAQWELEDAQAD